MNESEFELNGVVYVSLAVDYSNGCDGCAFERTGSGCAESPKCIWYDRIDKTDVIFLEKQQ